MKPTTPTRALTLALGAALALTLAGCGDEGADSTGGTGSSTSTTVSPTSETPEAFLTRLQSAADEAGSVAMTVGGNVMEGSGEIRFGQDRAATFRLNSEGDATQVVLVDGVVYSRDSADSSGRWQIMPAEQGADLIDGLTPEGTFLAMRSAATSVTRKGSEQLEGSPTTRYELTIDPAAAGENAGVTPSPGTPDIVYTFWVGDDDLLRRIGYTAGEASLVVDYTGWGDPVDVVAPPADQVDPAPTS